MGRSMLRLLATAIAVQMAMATPSAPPTPSTLSHNLLDFIKGEVSLEVLLQASETENLNGTIATTPNITLFAPLNGAFVTSFTFSLVDTKTLLLFHITLGTSPLSSLTNGALLPTAAGPDFPKLRVSIRNGVTYINQARIFNSSDVQASNGVLHMIDKLLSPLSVSSTLSSMKGFTTLATALNRTGIDLDALFTGSSAMTVFAPNDNAFNAYLQAAGMNLQQLLNSPVLLNILKLHVLPFEVLSSELTSGTVSALRGSLEVTVGYNTVTVSGGAHEVKAATATIVDISATNGVIHEIDSVLLSPEILTLLQQTPDLSSFVDLAEQTTGVVPALAEAFNATLFVPTNEAFSSFSGLYSDDVALLDYHFVLSEIQVADLFDGQVIETLAALPLRVSIVPASPADPTSMPVIKINQAKVLPSIDMMGVNGVVHGLDKVLVPSNAFDVIQYAAQSGTIGPFTNMIQAFEVAGLDQWLINNVGYTLFLTNDDIFDYFLLSVGSVNKEEFFKNPDFVKVIMELQIVPNIELLAEEIGNNTSYQTNAGGFVFTDINATSGEIYVTGGGNPQKGVVVTPNILSSNAVIHEISTLLFNHNIWTITKSSILFNDYQSMAQKAGLTDVLKKTLNLTLFAPNYTVFNNYISIIPPTEIVSYHLATISLNAGQLLEKGGVEINTVYGTPLRIYAEDISTIYINRARISDPFNMFAMNGVIHAIDTVLVPNPALEVLERAVSASKAGNFTVLMQALELTGLNETLATAEGYTIFAPSDAAFKKLFKANNIHAETLLASPFLADILLTHVILTEEILAADFVIAKNYTTANNNTLQVNIGTSGGVLFSAGGSKDAAVVNADIFSLNAVIHEIDTVLLTLSLETNVGDLDAAQSTKAVGVTALIVTMTTIIMMMTTH